jgi:cystathionine beta-lyase/cystathionine gamma-synthase
MRAVDRHALRAAALADWLGRQDGMQRVLDPGLPSPPQHGAQADVAVGLVAARGAVPSAVGV